MSDRGHRDGSPVNVLITLAAMAATGAMVSSLHGVAATAREQPLTLAAFFLLTLLLQLFSVEVYGRGSIGVSAIGMLATGFLLGAPAAVTVAFAAAIVQWVRKRGVFHRAVFDAANFSLSAGAAALLYGAITSFSHATAVQLAAATAAGLGWSAVNNGLLCVAMSLSESLPFRAVWVERFHWARFHFLAFGPLAAACALAYDRIGVLGPLAFAIPPALLLFSVRQYLDHTRRSVEELREKNDELAARNDDLHELFEFAGGLAARAHDHSGLIGYAEESLSRLTGGRVRVETADPVPGLALVSGGVRVGTVVVEETARFDDDRWQRLGETLAPQLATAIESAELVEEVRRVHLSTIAALSRSMEAKDYYTGGHTERVSEFAVALAKRLGYAGSDLDAIEIGALLHDIGKIGISERILHKPGPLDEDEQRVMREHPAISESILASADLPQIVREIARHHHERIDVAGYPDGLRGERIPLPARIISVADAFDALTTDRPYRRGRHAAAAIDALRADAGTQFCPTVIAALEEIWREDPQLLGATGLRAVEVA